MILKKFLYITLISGFGLLALNSEYLMTLKFGASAKISSVLGFVLGKSELEKEIARLRAENEDLKVKLGEENIPKENSIKVFSTYPMNNIKDIAIYAGLNNGVKEGDIVTFGRNILIGKVKKTFETYSVVTTIFDPSWKIEARIGEGEVDALFTGGIHPNLSLIPKDEKIASGDTVISAGLGLPYGLVLGKVKGVNDSVGAPLKDAIVEPIIKINELRNVQIRN